MDAEENSFKKVLYRREYYLLSGAETIHANFLLLHATAAAVENQNHQSIPNPFV